MKDTLKVGQFTELTQSESEFVDGGSIFSSVLDYVKFGITAIASPIPVIGAPVVGVSKFVLSTIESIASPIYSLVGWTFRG